jgi:hypothetical protein
MEHRFHCKCNKELFSINREEYGKQFKEHLIEQYKLYVEMVDRVSDRRERTNRFYISLLSLLLSLLSIVVGSNILNGFQTVVIMITGILGLGLCILRYRNICSYRQLNS